MRSIYKPIPCLFRAISVIRPIPDAPISPHRIAVIGDSVDQLRENLAALRNKNGSGDGYRGVSSGQIKPAFLFTGQGAHTSVWGLNFIKAIPFRKTMDHCQEILKDYLKKPLFEVLYSAPDVEGASLLHETAYTQPALFAVGYALAELWKSGASSLQPF